MLLTLIMLWWWCSCVIKCGRDADYDNSWLVICWPTSRFEDEIISITSPALPWLSMLWCILSKKSSFCPSPNETHFMILSAICLVVSDRWVRADLQQKYNKIGHKRLFCHFFLHQNVPKIAIFTITKKKRSSIRKIVQKRRN